jgi:hypothetical protein
MRPVDVGAGAAALALIASLGTATPAHAQFGTDLNGTYSVMSDGEWATKGAAPGGGAVFYDQNTVTETWTVDTSCVSPIECTGTVASSLGWTGTARLDDFWYVDHVVPNWLPCPDGSFAPGHQKFILWGIDPATNERQTKNMNFLAGRNQTKSPSGACGRNQPLVIEMPVKMIKRS